MANRVWTLSTSPLTYCRWFAFAKLQWSQPLANAAEEASIHLAQSGAIDVPAAICAKEPPRTDAPGAVGHCGTALLLRFQCTEFRHRCLTRRGGQLTIHIRVFVRIIQNKAMWRVRVAKSSMACKAFGVFTSLHNGYGT